jgi:hypothetical protein
MDERFLGRHPPGVAAIHRTVAKAGRKGPFPRLGGAWLLLVDVQMLFHVRFDLVLR